MIVSGQNFNIYSGQILDVQIQLQNCVLSRKNKLKLKKQLKYLKHVKICFDIYKQVMENKNEK